MVKHWLAGLLISLQLALWAQAKGPEAVEPRRETVVEVCRLYLDSADDDQRDKLVKRIAGYGGDFQPVIRELSQHAYRPIPPGYYPERRFGSAELRKKYPHDLLCFVVPKNYQPDRPTRAIAP